MNYQYSPDSFPQESSTGKLFYAVTDKLNVGFVVPYDIASGRSTLVWGSETKVNSQPHAISINVPLILGKYYYLWVAMDSGEDGNGASENGDTLQILTQNAITIRIP